jgi:hypothetical protein
LDSKFLLVWIERLLVWIERLLVWIERLLVWIEKTTLGFFWLKCFVFFSSNCHKLPFVGNGWGVWICSIISLSNCVRKSEIGRKGLQVPLRTTQLCWYLCIA